MLRFLKILALVLFATTSAHAASHGNPSLNANAKAVLNIPDVNGSNYVNIFHACGGLQFNTKTDYQSIDINGYQTTTLSSEGLMSCGHIFPGTYHVAWPGTRAFKLIFFNGYNCVNIVHATISGCGGSAPGFSFSFSSDGSGQAGSFDFTVDSNSAAAWNIKWTTGFAYGGSGELAMYRVSDAVLYAAGLYWTNEFIQLARGTNQKICRLMSIGQNGGTFNNETTWDFRRTPSNFGWANQLFDPSLWSSSPGFVITNTGGDAYTSAAASSTPGTVTAYEKFIGIISGANTTSAPTLNIGGRAVKGVVNPYGTGVDVGGLVNGNIYTFFYDPVLDKYVVNEPGGGGITAGHPIEAIVQLANLIGCDLWANIPAMVDDNYVTQWMTYVAANLRTDINFYPEFSNEVWNFSFPQTSWAGARGRAFGFSSSSNQDVYGYYGIRFKQALCTIGAGIFPGGLTGSRYRPVMAYQAAGDTTNWTNRFEGAQLCPIASGGSCAGNAAYNTFTGAASWNASPNRPIDCAKALAGAFYVQGQNLCETADNTCTPDSLNAPFYQSLATAWESGQAQTAYNLIDNDIRNGLLATQTVTCSGTTFTTPQAHGWTTSNSVVFTVAGGTSYSGITTYTGTNASALYKITGTTSNTFTVQPYVGGFPSGANVNCGTPGTGTLSVGLARNQTMLKSTSTWYMFGEASAERYNGGAGGSRPAGMGNLSLVAYEGGLELTGPSSAQCTSLGIVANNCNVSIQNAINAYWQSSQASQLMLDYLNQMMGRYSGTSNFGLMTYATAPSNLVLNGGGQWGLNNGFTSSFNPRTTLQGFQQFNTNP